MQVIYQTCPVNVVGEKLFHENTWLNPWPYVLHLLYGGGDAIRSKKTILFFFLWSGGGFVTINL